MYWQLHITPIYPHFILQKKRASMTNKWGPPTWNFFHTIVERIKDEEYPKIGFELVNHIIRISQYLPCPDCAKHATNYFKKIHPQVFKTKDGFKRVLYSLHDDVNYRTQKHRPTMADILEQYKHKSVTDTFNNFSEVYNTRGNMMFMMESFHRNRILLEFKHWIMLHISSFST